MLKRIQSALTSYLEYTARQIPIAATLLIRNNARLRGSAKNISLAMFDQLGESKRLCRLTELVSLIECKKQRGESVSIYDALRVIDADQLTDALSYGLLHIVDRGSSPPIIETGWQQADPLKTKPADTTTWTSDSA